VTRLARFAAFVKPACAASPTVDARRGRGKGDSRDADDQPHLPAQPCCLLWLAVRGARYGISDHRLHHEVAVTNHRRGFFTMRTRSKLLLGGLTAALILAAAVSTASARRIEISNQRFLALFPELTFAAEGFNPVICPVTLEGSFHSRTISKVSGQLIGYVTSAFVRESACAGGQARVLAERLPFHLRYDSFSATEGLPRIRLLITQLVGGAFRIANEIAGCLYTTTAARPARGNLERDVTTGIVRTLTALPESTIPGTFPCPTGHFEGTAEVFLQGSLTTRITATLVQ
jgi:hypothetical protein